MPLTDYCIALIAIDEIVRWNSQLKTTGKVGQLNLILSLYVYFSTFKQYASSTAAKLINSITHKSLFIYMDVCVW